jgi:hypothetical protein
LLHPFLADKTLLKASMPVLQDFVNLFAESENALHVVACAVKEVTGSQEFCDATLKNTETVVPFLKQIDGVRKCLRPSDKKVGTFFGPTQEALQREYPKQVIFKEEEAASKGGKRTKTIRKRVRKTKRPKRVKRAWTRR